IISLCWLAGSIIGFLPLFGWHETPQVDTCLFLKVMDYDYLVFLYFSTIITPALIMLAFYAHIYRVIIKQLRQIVTMNPSGGLSSESRRSSESSRIRISAIKPGRCKSNGHGGTMLRVLGAAQKREVKATQNLSIIVLFFMICWIPLYTINCVVAFCRDCTIPPTLMLFCIILSHLNSAVNPLLYAYHLKDFR
ncbi:AAEL011970-PA, partial [Aedes aegypti]